MKLWGGRFSSPTAPEVDDYHSSLGFDWRLYPYDIAGSMVHARMLARGGVLSAAEAEEICAGLDAIREDLVAGRILPSAQVAEDIHSFVEGLLYERIGDVAKKLHTGRSRNDQVALDTRLYVKDAILAVDQGLHALQEALTTVAAQHTETVMPGYTHMQRAQPVLFAHHLLAYFEMLSRDRGRLQDCLERVDVCPLGAGALAGVTYPVDPGYVAAELGLKGVTANSLDAVSDRDYLLELLAALSILAVHISRLCEELILWSSQEFGFIEFDDAYSTGSSIMPQKKNPDVAELARGKTGRVIGHLMAMLTMMKGLPLAYNKDMQEDKEALFDAVDTIQGTLVVFTPMIETMHVHADQMLAATKAGFLNATDLADYLVGKGMSFRDAHEVVGRTVLLAAGKGCALEDLSLDELRQGSELIAEDVFEAISMQRAVAARSSHGGTAPEEVQRQLGAAREYLQDHG